MKTFDEVNRHALDFIMKNEGSTSGLINDTINLSFQTLKNLKTKAIKSKPRITEITVCASEIPLMHDTRRDESGKIQVVDKTGLFKIEFTDGNWLYLVKFYPQGYDNGDQIVTIFYGSEKSVSILYKMLDKTIYNPSKPKTGLNRVYLRNGNLEYYPEKKEGLAEYEVIHPAYEVLKRDIEAFYDQSPELYQQYKKPKIRKTLLTGEPGSGKTSIAVKCSLKYAETCSIDLISETKTLVYHIYHYKDVGFPSIVIFEDCEYELSTVNSFELNFFDGINQPNIKDSIYIIFTTNYPQNIDERIIRRPGRIDRIIQVGSLTGKYALECAQYYFRNIYKIDNNDLAVFNNLTGAQIASIANTSVMYSLGQNTPITIEIIKKIKDDLITSIRLADKSAERDSLRISSGLGFHKEGPFD
jgi:ATPase family associated with various cellular activities (AAA)